MRISDWSSDVCSSDLAFLSPRWHESAGEAGAALSNNTRHENNKAPTQIVGGRSSVQIVDRSAVGHRQMQFAADDMRGDDIVLDQQGCDAKDRARRKARDRKSTRLNSSH